MGFKLYHRPKLAAWMKQNSLTNRQLAKEACCSETIVSKYVRASNSSKRIEETLERLGCTHEIYKKVKTDKEGLDRAGKSSADHWLGLTDKPDDLAGLMYPF